MNDRKTKMPMVFRTGFNTLFILIEVAVFLFIIVFGPWGFGIILQTGYVVVDKLPPFFKGWAIGFFFIGGFAMSLLGFIGLALAGRDSIKKAIKRIQVGRK